MWGNPVNVRKLLGLILYVGVSIHVMSAAHAENSVPSGESIDSAIPAPQSDGEGLPQWNANTSPEWNGNPLQQPDMASQPVRPVPGNPGKPVIGNAASPNFIEVGTNFSAVSNRQGDWQGEGVHGEMQTDPANRWKFDFLHQREFRDSGNYLSVGNVHSFNSDWYSDINVGTSTGGFFLPTYRIDAFLNKKWFEQRNFLTTIGYGHFQSRDIYADNSVYFGTTWYFMPYWILEDGIRYNVSSPGSVNSATGFVALTNGRASNYYVTVRYGYGKEAYQLVGFGNLISDFYSHSASISWRQWMLRDWGFDNDWGFATRAEYYTNPNYHRVGGYFGVFKEF